MKRINPRHSTVTRRPAPPPPPATRSRPAAPKVRRSATPARTSKVIGRIIDPGERSLLDVVDNLLNSGVMLNADLMLALANVDLVYVRLSALLCAADRVFPDTPAPR